MSNRILAAAFAVVACACAFGAPVPDNIDKAIDRGLAFLQASQKEDGSFDGRHGDTCALPALAGMACLSKGYTPTDKKYEKLINRSIDFILAHHDATGYFGEQGNGKMYSHAIATLFLSEVSGMVDPERQEKIDKVLPLATKVILDAQAAKKRDKNSVGGWRYTPNASDSDTSCSGWCLMALRSARLNGARFSNDAITKAVADMHRHHSKEKGCFGYQNPNQYGVTLSGAGILCLELCGKHNDPDSLAAAKYLMSVYKTEMERQSYKFYGMYYASQGLFQIGGESWREFSDWMYRNWLPQQRADGSWRGTPPGEDSPIYATSMMILAFAVPYRQLPIYQRDETVDEI